MLIIIIAILIIILIKLASEIFDEFWGSDHADRNRRELRCHNYSLTRYRQSRGYLNKNKEYAIHVRDVYVPRRAEIERQESIRLIHKAVHSEVAKAFQNGMCSVKFCFLGTAMNIRNKELQMIVINVLDHEYGFKGAVVRERDKDSRMFKVFLREKSEE